MSTFLCKNGVRKEYFLTPTFIIEPKKSHAKGTALYSLLEFVGNADIDAMSLYVRIAAEILVLTVIIGNIGFPVIRNGIANTDFILGNRIANAKLSPRRGLAKGQTACCTNLEAIGIIRIATMMGTIADVAAKTVKIGVELLDQINMMTLD